MSNHHAQNLNQSHSAGSQFRLGLEHARQQLLDLGLRNNLLNYRLLKSRGVESAVVDPDDLYSTLVSSGRQIRFRAEPKAEQAPQEEPGLEQIPRSSSAGTILAVDSDDTELQRRLLNTHDAARSVMEEQGLNTLFLAFGTLEWFEADSSQTPRFAPLVLVPVELTRRDATARFALTWSGEEIGANLSLEAKLESEFRIQVPLFDSETGAISGYFESFQQAVARQKRWRVDPHRVVLGQFSFNKFLMYHDLDFDLWPEELQPMDHPVLQGLLSQHGFPAQPSNYSEQQFLDDVVSDDDHPMVVDADSSQTLALLDAIDGRTMVIQGPPGTGKSQTITNLIALSVGQGKRVLFVAEKMAALEVVKRRLDHLGLGVACLELHGTKTRKRRVLDDLSATLGLGEPYLPHDLDNQRRLGANRAWLNEYSQALSAPVGQSGVSAYSALGEVVKARAELPVQEWPPLPLQDVAGWTPETLHSLAALVADLQSTRKQIGVARDHPYRGVRRTSLTPVETENLWNLIHQALTALTQVAERNVAIWERLRVEPKGSPAAIRTAIATGRRASTVEAQGEIQYANPVWKDRTDDIESLLNDGKMATELIEQRRTQVINEAWEADLDQLLGNVSRFRGNPFRWFFWSYWATRGELRKYLTADAPDDFDSQLEILLDVRRCRTLRASIENQDSFGVELFRSHWSGIDSDWEALGELAASARTLHEDVEREGLNSSLLDALDHGIDRQELARLATSLAENSAATQQLVKRLCSEFAFAPAEFDSSVPDVDKWSVSDQIDLVRRWQDNFRVLHQWVAFRGALRACQEAGLESVTELGWSWAGAGEQLEELFHYRCHLELLDHAWRTHGVLGSGSADNKENRRSEFSRLDQAQLGWNQALLARKHWENLPKDGGGGQLRILTTEIQKKRRNLPIRQLMERAGSAIQAVKPVFMMSPLSVANFIPPGSLEFDLVIFDEASQVAPVDAFGAILRGRQSIVVGDDRQLPPTTFFERTMEQDDLDDDPTLVSPGDMQSILNLFVAQNAPQRMLRWHYRSQHESLIAVSNSEFYDNRLVVFPSPSRRSADGFEPGGLGLYLNHLPDTVYDRGASRTNQDEARAVAAKVMQHVADQPDLTLGVAAFSSAQAEAIRDHLEILRRENPSEESFFSEQRTEPFFVKSLENVQGDERDVILISVGYGRDQLGRVSMNFGPINNDGGERRLNVLISRARRRCEVFTNITDEDIPNTSASVGVRALRTFLHYARTGQFPPVDRTSREADSPFEEAVRRALERAGFEVHSRIGSAGYFIDLAIVDPQRPGRYVLAIECDGASYHSARSSRDRDRLRQQVLEGLGWTFHRIWSTDWFADPERELRRVISAIDAAIERGPEPPEPRQVHPAPGEQIIRDNPVVIGDADDPPFLPPYEVSDVPLPEVSTGLAEIDDRTLAQAVLEVVTAEGPVHMSIVFRRITHAAGMKRTGNRIQERVGKIIQLLEQRNYLNVRGHYLWPRGMEAPVPRSRANLEPQERKVELVAPEELDVIIIGIVERSFSISGDETVRMVIRSLGLQRTGQNAGAIVERRIVHLLGTGQLSAHNGMLSISHVTP